jgi:hypothetical protein
MDVQILFTLYLISGVIFGFACAAIWGNKGGNRFLAFLLGFLLGIIGLIIIVATNPKTSVRAGEMSPPPATRA